MQCSVVRMEGNEIKDVDLGPLDALQYPSLAVDALQSELERTRHHWRVDVEELESLYESSQPEKSEEAWKEEVGKLKQDLEVMTGRYEAALRENVESLRVANRDIKELEDMVVLLSDQNAQLSDQNAQLQNKLNSMDPPYGGPHRDANHDAIKHSLSSDSQISQISSVNEPLVEPDVASLLSASPMARSVSPVSDFPDSSPLSASALPVMYFNIDKDPEPTLATMATGDGMNVGIQTIPALP